LENGRYNSLKVNVGGNGEGCSSGRKHKANRKTKFSGKAEIRFHINENPSSEVLLQTTGTAKSFDGPSVHRAQWYGTAPTFKNIDSLMDVVYLLGKKRSNVEQLH